MSHDPKYIEELVSKFQEGRIRPDEFQTLVDWYNAHDDTQVSIPLANDESRDALKARVLDGVFAKVREDRPLRRRLVTPFRLRWVAAAVVLFIFGAIWVNKRYLHPKVEQPVLQNTSIEPGGNKATLRLADGREIALSTSQEGIVIDNGITYSDGTNLEDNGIRNQTSGQISNLVLQTPRGGTYSISLADGTRVWLNAASTLTYPTRFTDEERVVEVTGEAYFDVASIYRTDGSRIPFKVISKQQEIEVLGTQFNISAYPEQPYSKTTLVEGKVVLKDQQQHFILQPGDQATTTGENIRIKQVSVNTFTAWRNGKFSFDGKSFSEIMTEISHWYDLTVVYEGKVPNEELVGDAFRNQNLDFVLRLLDVAEINYTLDVAKRKLVIKGNKIKFNT